METGAIRKPDTPNDLAFASFYKRDWRRFYLKWYGDYLPSAQRLCPRTVELLRRTPSVHAAMFAVLAPKSHLVRHRDPFAGSVRYHLGLVTPNSDRCRIFVDGQPYVWHDGEDVVFDETYVHRAENKTDTWRIILFCDVERPLRYRAARTINRFAIHYVMGITATMPLLRLCSHQWPANSGNSAIASRMPRKGKTVHKPSSAPSVSCMAAQIGGSRPENQENAK